jgi:hypothetical protein
MKAECNVNVGEVVNIVQEMMADKNKFGRQAFQAMTNEEDVVEESLQAQVEGETPTVIEFLNDVGQLDSSSANDVKLLHQYTWWLRKKYKSGGF